MYQHRNHKYYTTVAKLKTEKLTAIESYLSIVGDEKCNESIVHHNFEITHIGCILKVVLLCPLSNTFRTYLYRLNNHNHIFHLISKLIDE